MLMSKSETWLINSISSKIAKALVIRNHESTFEFVEKLSELFDEPELGWDAARAIGRIAGGGERILTKGNNAIIRVSYTLFV